MKSFKDLSSLVSEKNLAFVKASCTQGMHQLSPLRACQSPENHYAQALPMHVTTKAGMKSGQNIMRIFFFQSDLFCHDG